MKAITTLALSALLGVVALPAQAAVVCSVNLLGALAHATVEVQGSGNTWVFSEISALRRTSSQVQIWMNDGLVNIPSTTCSNLVSIHHALATSAAWRNNCLGINRSGCTDLPTAPAAAEAVELGMFE